jgi:hypothetical protein
MTKKAVWGTIAGGIAAAALATAVAFAVPAAAQTGGQAVAAGQGTAVVAAGAAIPGKTAIPDKTALCDRLKKNEQRRQALQTRLSADANTRGSVAWLTAKAASATAAGDQALAKLYTDRATLRSQVMDPLKTVTADLDAVIKAKCS